MITGPSTSSARDVDETRVNGDDFKLENLPGKRACNV